MRDWGYAPEYVEAMWQVLQQDEPNDYVIGTGESHTVQEFVEKAFAYAGLDWQRYVEVDPRYFRPTDVGFLQADASRAKQKLGWEPKVGFDELIAIMVDADLVGAGLAPIGRGEKILSAKFESWHQQFEVSAYY